MTSILNRLVLVIGLAVSPQGLLAKDATCIWRTEPTDQGYVEVELSACGPTLCGTILRASDLAGQEQAYEHTGKRMIWDMAGDGAGRWTNGRIWDPRNGRTFKSRMELDGTTLKVSGCVLGICQTQTSRRVQ